MKTPSTDARPSDASPSGNRDLTAIIGRRGAAATLALHTRKAGAMLDRRTRRNRTRAAQARRAINDEA
jgi:hypothetical protein